MLVILMGIRPRLWPVAPCAGLLVRPLPYAQPRREGARVLSLVSWWLTCLCQSEASMVFLGMIVVTPEPLTASILLCWLPGASGSPPW